MALTPSAGYGLSLAANNVPLAAGQVVLLAAEQFPSNVYPWTDKARRAGGEVRFVSRPEDGDWTRAVLAELDERVAVVALPNVHWTDGGIFDLARIGARAREAGAALVVDATQSLGALPFDVGAIQPDFVAGAGYKWLMGPYSLGYLYAAPHCREAAPIEHNWIQKANAREFSRLVDYTEDWQPGARRLDCRGTLQLRAGAGGARGSAAGARLGPGEHRRDRRSDDPAPRGSRGRTRFHERARRAPRAALPGALPARRQRPGRPLPGARGALRAAGVREHPRRQHPGHSARL